MLMHKSCAYRSLQAKLWLKLGMMHGRGWPPFREAEEGPLRPQPVSQGPSASLEDVGWLQRHTTKRGMFSRSRTQHGQNDGDRM